MNILRVYKILLFFVLLAGAGTASSAQTAKSLFWRRDSLQVDEIVSERGDLYREVGHHGPAVENSHFALRIYFNDSGAIDVYSKCGRGMELEQYLWYPDTLAQNRYGAGCDEYVVGKTLGLGGIALWDGEKVVKLKATKGRTARVGKKAHGCHAEMIAYGVPYDGGLVDISIRVDVTSKNRLAVITARELSGKKVRFVTGVNFHEGANVKCEDGRICIWGKHPAQVSANPINIGAGMFYPKSMFVSVEKKEDMVMLVSKPTSNISTKVVAASVKEAELNTARRFESYMLN